MSDFGDVYIYPVEFFQVVGVLRARGAAENQGAITAVDVLHGGGTETLGALLAAITDARTAMSTNLEIAARVLSAAGANTISADMAEEGLRDYTHLASPGYYGPAGPPTDDVPLYGDIAEFVEGD